MTTTQSIFIELFAVYAFSAAAFGYRQCKYYKNAFTLTPHYYPLGAFVWGDAVIFGVFWFGLSVAVLMLDDWLLFLLSVSLFWVVRSLGETIYWFNQQFSPMVRNDVTKMPGASIFHNDSIWFVYQIIAQCITVVSLILSIYFGVMWVRSFQVI